MTASDSPKYVTARMTLSLTTVGSSSDRSDLTACYLRLLWQYSPVPRRHYAHVRTLSAVLMLSLSESALAQEWVEYQPRGRVSRGFPRSTECRTRPGRRSMATHYLPVSTVRTAVRSAIDHGG